MLENRRIVVGVTGGIAAYKAAELVSRLKKAGAQVRAPTAVFPPVIFQQTTNKKDQPLRTDLFSLNGAVCFYRISFVATTATPDPQVFSSTTSPM